MTTEFSIPVVKSEPLTYHRECRESFFRDLLLKERIPGADERLRRHAQEMDVITKEREQRAWRDIRSGGFETRVEPNRTDGYGGYFTVPDWLNQFFATAVRPTRVLAGLIPGTFVLPAGVSSINLPILTKGTTVQPVTDATPVPAQGITDTAGSSTVVTLTGMADVALQALEQSPAGAHLDWALFSDMSEAYDADLETQLLTGLGTAYNQLLACRFHGFIAKTGR
jgi:hypothetical protein